MRRNLAGVLTIGVTGTKGKTSTCEFIAQLMEASGLLTAVSTTESSRIGSRYMEACENGQELYSFVAKCHRSEVQCLVVELCSSALRWNLQRGFDADVAVLTNIGTDHIGYHGNRRNYVSVKQRLFRDLSVAGTKPNAIAILNNDDRLVGEFIKTVPNGARTCLYGWRSRVAEKSASLRLKALDIRDTGKGTSFQIEGLMPGPLTCRTTLHGDFNVSNVLAAVGCCVAVGLAPRKVVARARSLVPPRGRFDIVLPRTDRFPTVIVDYAHTPESLHCVLTATRTLFPNGLIHAVFGCGGDTDKTKRAAMGRIAARVADTVTLTTDNPRSESPAAIVKAIRRGIPVGKRRTTRIQLDRLRAIRTAIGQASPEDAVVILGKGNEQFQEVAGRAYPFSDARAALSIVDSLRMAETSTAPVTLNAIAGVLLDCEGQPLFVHHPDLIHPPASLAKLMTLYLAFEAITAGNVQLRDRVRPSPYALLTPHGKLRPDDGKTHSLLSLLKAAMAISDNSSATAIAEHVATDETSFVKRMNQKCRELGLRSTQFATPHGLPHRNQWSSARDLARLTMRLFCDYPAAGRLLSPSHRKDAKRGYAGSSHLFEHGGGILGFKTGYTEESGYNLAVAARRRGRTLFAVTLGSTSRASSFTDAARLLRRGFSIN